MLVKVFLLAVCCQVFAAKLDTTKTKIVPGLDEHVMHPVLPQWKNSVKINPDELTSEFWINNARATIANKVQKVPNTNIAKNVILFLGDGMSIPTLAATRVYIGGEEQQLAFDKFPHTALSKTYCVDSQVADSACSATAYLCGVKANTGTMGVNAAVPRGDCEANTHSDDFTPSIAVWFQEQSKKTGIVTTARVTHASPGGVYAHIANRDWESDTNVLDSNNDPNVCPDIAHQLVHWQTGQNLDVILGGGRHQFIPKEDQDEQGNAGGRSDGVNLINDWKDQNPNGVYVWNRTELLNIDENTERLLGLFDADHIQYNLDRDDSEPSLEEMTEAAIKVLQKGNTGFFLFVEGGRIDMAHHEARAHKALDEASEFSKAIQKAVNLTSEDDTLIVVTSDHAHTLSFAGYPQRGSDIFGLAGTGADGLPYSTLSYANGPGYKPNDENGNRHDLSEDDLTDINFTFPGTTPLGSESHGGDDVGIFARGPWSHLYAGVVEQNVIPMIMAYASCVGDGPTACADLKH